VRVAHLLTSEKAAPLPLFWEEYDSVGVRWWGCAKNVIRWELEGRAESRPELRESECG